MQMQLSRRAGGSISKSTQLRSADLKKTCLQFVSTSHLVLHHWGNGWMHFGSVLPKTVVGAGGGGRERKRRIPDSRFILLPYYQLGPCCLSNTRSARLRTHPKIVRKRWQENAVDFRASSTRKYHLG